MRAGAETLPRRCRTRPSRSRSPTIACTADGGAEAARQFVAARGQVVVGFLCTRSDRGGAADPQGRRHPDDRRRRAHRQPDRPQAPRPAGPSIGSGPRADSEREAVGRAADRGCGENELFAIVDDGTIYGRELSESLRLAAEQAGLKPVFVDTFRPQADNQIGLVGRLQARPARRMSSSAAMRDDIAVMGRDAARARGRHRLCRRRNAARAAGRRAARRRHADGRAARMGRRRRPGGHRRRFAERSMLVPEGYVLPAYAAVEIARQALMQPACPRQP